jgi:hypothetical protein
MLNLFILFLKQYNKKKCFIGNNPQGLSPSGAFCIWKLQEIQTPYINIFLAAEVWQCIQTKRTPKHFVLDLLSNIFGGLGGR